METAANKCLYFIKFGWWIIRFSRIFLAQNRQINTVMNKAHTARNLDSRTKRTTKQNKTNKIRSQWLYTIAVVSNVPVDADAAVHSEGTQRNESTHILNYTNATLHLTLLTSPPPPLLLLLHHQFVLIRCQPCSPWSLTVNVMPCNSTVLLLHACTTNSIHTHTRSKRENLHADLMSVFVSHFRLFLEHSLCDAIAVAVAAVVTDLTLFFGLSFLSSLVPRHTSNTCATHMYTPTPAIMFWHVFNGCLWTFVWRKRRKDACRLFYSQAQLWLERETNWINKNQPNFITTKYMLPIWRRLSFWIPIRMHVYL